MKVCITGTNGTIGKVLSEGLKDKYDLLLTDKVKGDGIEKVDLLNDVSTLEFMLKDVDSIIHLAWDSRENCNSGIKLEENIEMVRNVYTVALREDVGKVIVASSVHYGMGYFGWPPIHDALHGSKVFVNTPANPISEYGKSKVEIEHMGKRFSGRAPNFKVVAARLGHVTKNDKPGDIPFMLFHDDCIQFFDKCLQSTNLSQFCAFYVISNNECNPFDLTKAKRQIEYVPNKKTKCPGRNVVWDEME